MGGRNVKAVYALWGDLPDGAFRLLAYMAAIALDEDDPPRFYAGRETMAYALGWVVADKTTTDPAEVALREQAFKSVYRQTSVLKKAGAITTIVAAAPGRTAEYGLNLRAGRPLNNWSRSRPRLQKKESRPEAPEADAPTAEEGNASNSFDTTPPNDLGERLQFFWPTPPNDQVPQEEKDQERSRGEEEMNDLSTTSHPPRAKPGTKPTSTRCPTHDIPLKPRTDGKEACGFCRREQRNAQPDHEPAPPPPTRPPRCNHGYAPDRCATCLAVQHIAPVIDLNSRRAS